jgi:PAS domain S-box-containing protein/putative nucleotidyltransferase with HDIG domain
MGVILIAFERESELTALDQLLSGRGHRVVKSANGLAALDTARREPPDAIVSDIVLPRMDGFALCRKWKQDDRLQSIPFIFYTRRHDDPKYERFALELGAQRFLARTVQPEALTAVIDELVATDSASATRRLASLSDTAIRQRSALEQAQRAQQRSALEQAQQAQQRTQEALESAQQAQEKTQQTLGRVEEALATAQQTLERTQQEHEAASAEAREGQTRLRGQLAELEATNERLAAGEARFRRVFEANTIPMWIADHATDGFIAVNDAALRLYGYGHAEFLSLKSPALSAPQAVEQVFANPPQGIAIHKAKDGRTIAVALASHEIEFDGRRADLVSAYDLTERLSAERGLERQFESNRTLFAAAADGMWLMDGDGRLLDVNAAYCRMSGYDRDALLKLNSADIEDPDSGETTMRLQLGRSGTGERYETRHRRADGSFMEVEVSVGIVGSGKGESVVAIRDVTQRRREVVAQRVQQRQLEFLVDLFRQSNSFDESAIVRRLIEQAADATASPVAYLYFVDAARKTMTLAAWRAQQQTTMANAEPRPIARSGLFTECVRAKHATSSNDLTWKPQPDGLPDLQRYVAVPMIAQDEVVAVVGVANRDAGYDEEDQRMLGALADGVWRVLQTKRAHAHTLGSLQRADIALQGLVDSLVRMVERHDPYTAGTSRRLAALAVALGREAGLDGERQHALRVAALLHDIGNVAVPATILSKPAPLTETELALMRSHVEEGRQLLADIDFGAPIADIVYQHHERYDGSGYPRGLKGEEILIEARILAIADTVEAMCSSRPYRPAVGIETAIDEINRGAGRLYDLHLVAACTRLVRQHGFVLPE